MSEQLHLTFICCGNICGSPIAEKMFAQQIEKRGLTHAVPVSSAGTGGRHVLCEHGYPTAHRAAQVHDDHMSADLLIASGGKHVRMLADRGLGSDRIRMLRSFDPRSGGHRLDAEDPHYGEQSDFEDVYRVIEAALAGRHQWVYQQLARPGVGN